MTATIATVTIAGTVLDAILSHAAAAPGREVCGLLLGEAGVIRAAIPVANVAADPARRFELDPAAHFAALRAARAGGPAVIGHYHSHPDGRAEPSPRDAAGAHDPAACWMIVAGGRATLWRPAAGGFRRLALTVDPGDGCVKAGDPPQERP